MDIQGWLQGTADRAPPNPSDEVDLCAFGSPTQSVEATDVKRYYKKRKRATSDSSIIAVQQRTDRRGKADDRPANATRLRAEDVSVTQSHAASRYRRPRPQEHGEDGSVQTLDRNPYEKRARRKTKPDRYEPKKQNASERKQRDDTGERKSRRKRKQAHRSGDGKRTESLVQRFKLKNRPSNSRLTLKPDNFAGLFRHGRASAQMAGRKNGLPDLVFNELKFLQNSHEHQDERHSDSNGHRPTGQEKKREVEREEISAYFNQRTSRTHALEPSLSKQTETKQKLSCDNDELHGLPERGSSPLLPDEELTAIPYLGFGSKGTINKSGDPHPSATTHLNWSESAATSDTQARHLTEVKPVGEYGQSLTAKKAPQRRPERDLTSRPPSDTVEPPVRKGSPDVPKGQWSKLRRTRGPAKAEVYIQQSNAEPDPPRNRRKLHDSTSMSLPTRPPVDSGRKRQLKPVVQKQVLPSDAGSFNTSDILKVKGRLEALAEEVPSTIQSVRSPQSDKENAQPTSSSPTTKILRIAHEAMAKGYQEPIARSPRVANQVFPHVDEGEHGQNSYTFQKEGPGPNHPHLQDLDVNDFAYQTMQTNALMRGQGAYQQGQHDAENFPVVGFNPEDDEMLDGCASFEPAFADHADATTDHVPAYTYAPPTTEPDLESLSFRYGRPSTRARDVPWSRGGMSAVHRDTIPYAAAAEQGLLNEEDHVGDLDFQDGLEGFWRPNRLY